MLISGRGSTSAQGCVQTEVYRKYCTSEKRIHKKRIHLLNKTVVKPKHYRAVQLYFYFFFVSLVPYFFPLDVLFYLFFILFKSYWMEPFSLNQIVPISFLHIELQYYALRHPHPSCLKPCNSSSTLPGSFIYFFLL